MKLYVVTLTDGTHREVEADSYSVEDLNSVLSFFNDRDELISMFHQDVWRMVEVDTEDVNAPLD